MYASFGPQLTLFENPAIEKPRLRREPHDGHMKYTREVKGGAFQARVWVGHKGYSLNLGLFTQSEWGESHRTAWRDALWAASRASREFVKRWHSGRAIAEVVADLKAAGFVPEGLVVPARVARWKPPRNAELLDAGERRQRAAERRDRWRYGGRSLLTLGRRGPGPVPMAA